MSIRQWVAFVFLFTGPAGADDRLLLLSSFVEDIFHVTQSNPEEINKARGYSGIPNPPENKSAETNLYSMLSSYEPNDLPSCQDFTFKSWNDWRELGTRDGEIIAFGYWNTPIQFIRRRTDDNAGVIAIPSGLQKSQILKDGKLTSDIRRRLLSVRGGYQKDYVEWAMEQTMELQTLQKCGKFKLVEVQFI